PQRSHRGCPHGSRSMRVAAVGYIAPLACPASLDIGILLFARSIFEVPLSDAIHPVPPSDVRVRWKASQVFASEIIPTFQHFKKPDVRRASAIDHIGEFNQIRPIDDLDLYSHILPI